MLYFYCQIFCFEVSLFHKMSTIIKVLGPNLVDTSLAWGSVSFDEFLNSILHALFYTVILIHSSLHVAFSLNLKFFSYIFSYMYAFYNHIILTF